MELLKNTTARTVGGLLILGVIAWLAFGFFGIQSAFLDDEVSEAGPVFTSATEPTEEEQDVVAATEEFQEAMAEPEANPTEVEETQAEVEEEMAEETGEVGEIVTLYEANFAGESRYTIDGDALVLNDGSEQRFLRFENFASDNGPDLKVYLRAANGDFVSLGELKGNIGDQNYEIPVDVDLDVFSEVQIWCERFGVNFGSAVLTSTA